MRIKLTHSWSGKDPRELTLRYDIPRQNVHNQVMTLKMWFVKNWNAAYPSDQLIVRETYFMDSHGIIVHDADPISSVVHENMHLRLEVGADTFATIIPPSSLCGHLESSGSEVRRRAHERKKESMLAELERPKTPINYVSRCQKHMEHKTTPFELAGIGATDRMFEILKRDNTDINAVDAKGRSCLYIACTFDHYNTAAELLDHGGDPNLPDNEGWTSLSVACRYGYVSLLILLLDKNADRSWRARDGVWQNDHLKVHMNACTDEKKRAQVWAIVRGHRIAASWLEIIDSHWQSVGGRPDYEAMLRDTTKYLEEYAAHVEAIEKKEAEEALLGLKKSKTSSMNFVPPWNIEDPLSPERKQSITLLQYIFDKIDFENVGRITKEQLFTAFKDDEDIILKLARFSSFKPLLRVELFSDVFDSLVTKSPGTLTFDEFMRFIRCGEEQSENRLLLRRLFDAIDTAQSGLVEKVDMLEGLSTNVDAIAILMRKPQLAVLLKPNLFDEALFKMKTGTPGMISFEEFVRFVGIAQTTAGHRERLRKIFDIVDEKQERKISKRSILKAFACNEKVIKLVSDEPLMRTLLVPRLWEKAFLTIKHTGNISPRKGPGPEHEYKLRLGKLQYDYPTIAHKQLISFEEFAGFVLNQKSCRVNPILLEYLFQSMSQMNDDETSQRQMFRSLTRDTNMLKILDQAGPLRRLVQGRELKHAFHTMSKKRGFFTLKDFLKYAMESEAAFKTESKTRQIFKQTINDMESSQ